MLTAIALESPNCLCTFFLRVDDYEPETTWAKLIIWIRDIISEMLFRLTSVTWRSQSQPTSKYPERLTVLCEDQVLLWRQLTLVINKIIPYYPPMSLLLSSELLSDALPGPLARKFSLVSELASWSKVLVRSRRLSKKGDVLRCTLLT